MAKRIALYVGSWLILLALLIFPCFAVLEATAEPTIEYETTYETQPRVYVTNYGEKYHNGSCHYLHSSKIPKGLTEARRSGYDACSYCNGTPSGTIEVAHQTRVEIPPEPTNVWDAVGVAALVAILPSVLIAVCIDRRFITTSQSVELEHISDAEDDD